MANLSVKQAHRGEQWHSGCAMLTYDVRYVLSPSSSLSSKDLQRWCFTFWLTLCWPSLFSIYLACPISCSAEIAALGFEQIR